MLIKHVMCNESVFRSGTQTSPRNVNFKLAHGAIGDFIGYMSAIEWIARTHPHVHGRLYCPDRFYSIAKNVLETHPHWTILKGAPDDSHPTLEPAPFPINACGAHMVDLGFMYFANINPPPPGEGFYPKLNLEKQKNPKDGEGRYAVLCAGYTTKMRRWPPKVFNAVAQYLRGRGITPVALGQKYVGDRPTNFSGFDFKLVEDLRNKTTLLEAAKVIEEADLIIGLDNGLLHLAGMTDTPIIFGYNVASPVHRQPRRRGGGKILNIAPSTKALSCTFCQSNMRHLYTHSFDKCLYDDLKCLDALSNPEPWINCVDRILSEKDSDLRANGVLA